MAQENNCIIVIFGASGDLTKRKLMPAIYALYRQNLLPKNFAILGTSRSPYSDEAFRQKIVSDIKTYASLKMADQKQLVPFSKHLYYQALDATDINHYEDLKMRLAEIDKKLKIGGNYIYYLSGSSETESKSGSAHLSSGEEKGRRSRGSGRQRSGTETTW